MRGRLAAWTQMRGRRTGAAVRAFQSRRASESWRLCSCAHLSPGGLAAARISSKAAAVSQCTAVYGNPLGRLAWTTSWTTSWEAETFRGNCGCFRDPDRMQCRMTRVLITRSLLVSKSNQKYNDELKKEQVMNKAAEATAEGAEVARKRKAEEAEGPRQRSRCCGGWCWSPGRRRSTRRSAAPCRLP